MRSVKTIIDPEKVESERLPRYYHLTELQEHFRRNIRDINVDFLLGTPLGTNYTAKIISQTADGRTISSRTAPPGITIISQTVTVDNVTPEEFHPTSHSLKDHLSFTVLGTLATSAIVILDYNQRFYLGIA